MVDIDEICVSVCREHMKAHHAGAFDDPRFELVIDDAKNQMELAPDHSFDVIICDLADPIPDGPCYLLYTKEWFELCKRKLTLGGVFLTQSGPSGLGTFKSVFSPVHHTLQQVVSFSLSLSLSQPLIFSRTANAQVFTYAAAYNSHVPSFTDLYGFNVATDGEDLMALSPETVDARLLERLGPDGVKVLRHFDGEALLGMRALSKCVRKGLAEETHVITAENPAFMPA